MNLVKTTLLSGLNTAVRMAAGLLSVKAMAIFVGPAGVAYLGQFQSLLTITNNCSNLGIGQGIIKYTAEHKDNPENLKKLFKASALISLIASLILGVLIAFYSASLSIQLFGSTEHQNVFYVLAIALVFYSFNQTLMAVVNGFKLIKQLVTARIISAISGLFVTIGLIYFFGLSGALYALIISQGLGFLSLALIAKKQWWFNLKNFFGKVDSKTLKALLEFSVVSLVSIILLHCRQIYLRDYLISNFSAEEAGYWQAMWKISEVYLMVVTSALSMYYLPKLSETKSAKGVKQEIVKTLKLVIPAVLVSTIGIYIIREIVVNTLFSEEFAEVADLFFYQLIGDNLKIAAWLISFVMIAKAMTRLFLITEIIFILLFGGLAIFLSKYYGIEGFTMAFAITYSIYLLTNLIIFRNLLFKKNPTLK